MKLKKLSVFSLCFTGALFSSVLISAKASENIVKKSVKQDILGRWIKDSKGWWYENIDKSYPKNSWKFIEGKWYYFDENGYILQNKWQGEYYLGSSGAMLVSAWTPDGKRVDSLGRLTKVVTKRTGHSSGGYYHSTISSIRNIEKVPDIKEENQVKEIDKKAEESEYKPKKVEEEKTEKTNGTSKDETTKDKQVDVVPIEDSLLRKVINKNIDINRNGDEEISIEDMEKLTEISLFLKEDGSADFSDDAKVSILGEPRSLRGTKDFKFAVSRGIKSIKGLEYAKNLEKLKLNENEISDISPLQNLTKLKYLELQRNRIVDINPLRNLTNLEFLKLYNNWIEDVEPLSGLTNLTGLDLHYNVHVAGDESHKIISKGITDISSLENLTNLNFLDVSANRIENVSILNKLPNISHLDFSGNRVNDYTGLGEYISTRVAKMYNEENPEGSINFYAQTINYEDTIEGKENPISFICPFKGIAELSRSLGETFGDEELNVFSNIETSVEGVVASYNKEEDKIVLDIPYEIREKYKGKEFNLNLKISFDAFEWYIKGIKVIL